MEDFIPEPKENTTSAVGSDSELLMTVSTLQKLFGYKLEKNKLA